MNQPTKLFNPPATAPAQAPAAGMVLVPKKTSLLAAMAERYSIEPEKMAETIKATCFSGKATNEELIAFLAVAHRYGLDPFRKEIHAFRKGDGSGVQVIVGIDGWAHIVNSQPEFDGVEFEDIWREVPGSVEPRLYAVTCTMWRRDRSRPTKVTEYLHECVQGSIPWKNQPSRMLRHKAFIQCARIAFSVSGIVDEAESDEPLVAGQVAPPATSASDRLKALASRAVPAPAKRAPATVIEVLPATPAPAPEPAPAPAAKPASPEVSLATPELCAILRELCERQQVGETAMIETVAAERQLDATKIKRFEDLPLKLVQDLIDQLGG